MSDSWEESQKKTMIKWLNAKLETENADTPAIGCGAITTLEELASGLVLIKVTNQIVHEILSNDKHPLHRAKLYYLHPTYARPTFRIQKMENLSEWLQFARLILNINVSFISAENIHDGHPKLVLGLVWSLFLLSNATVAAGSYSELKHILVEWLATRGMAVNSFIWTKEQAERIFCRILRVPPMDLGAIIDHAHREHAIPKYIEDEQDLADEKCVVAYLVEWYKCPFKAHTKCNDAVALVVNSVRLKNRYETNSLRFINRLNRYVATGDKALLTELTDVDHPELVRYASWIKANLDQVNVVYMPSIKPLSLENVTERLVCGIRKRKEMDENEETTTTDVNIHTPSTVEPTRTCDAEEFARFVDLLGKHSSLTHFELCKFLKQEVVTAELEPGTLDAFIKLIPKRSVCVDHDFKLTSSSSQSSLSETPENEQDFIFDVAQQRLDGQLTGNADKVYDLGEFVDNLNNGFNV